MRLNQSNQYIKRVTLKHEKIHSGQSSQFIVATHSPIIMAYPDSLIYEFTNDGLRKTELESTGHYSIMKQFFEDKDRLLFHLFGQ